MTIEAFLMSILALTFGALAYFCKRLIDQNDEQHKKTRSHIQVISKEISDLKAIIAGIERTYNNLRAAGRFNGPSTPEEIQAVKKKVSSALIGIHQVQKDIDKIQSDIDKILPQVEDNKKNYGEIIWIKDEISNQNKKMKTMYQVMSKIVEQKKH